VYIQQHITNGSHNAQEAGLLSQLLDLRFELVAA
jgi:hypothetical protein